MDTEGAARFIASLDLNALPAQVVAHAKHCVMDTLGVLLGGLDTRAARIAREVVEARGGKEESSLMGSVARAPAPQAAFANCVAASAMDMDDGHNLGGHPGAVVVPSALAVAEAQGASGRGFLEGIVAGYEIAIRAMENLVSQESGGPHPFPATGQPYHSTGTGGAYGAAAASAKLLGCNEEQTAQALGIAAANTPSTRPYQIQVLGHTTKECIGWGGITGVEAAFLAKHGFTGPNTLFDDERARGTSVDTIGTSFEILNNYFKAYPSCRYTHAALDATIALIKEHSLDADDIARVRVRLKKHHAALDNPRPVTIEQAQYSFPFVLGAVLAYGHHGPDTMTEEKLRDAAILRQADKVSLEPDPSLETERWPAIVTIETGDGKTYRLRRPIPKGDPKEPMTEEELTSKFMMVASPVLGRDGAKGVVAAIRNLESVADIRELTTLLCQAGR